MNLEKYIDHTILKPDATTEELNRICEEAKKYGFASVCVNPYHAKKVSEILKETEIKCCVVVGFPLGANTKEVKAFEAKQAIANGAEEIDMVINVGALKDKNYAAVKSDIEAVAKETKGRALIKVIIETCLLTEEEKIKACELSVEAGADFVKTSTGFSTSGANGHDVALMRKAVGQSIGVKAAGGIRDYNKALEMIEAGASRLGLSSSVSIVNSAKKNSEEN